MPRGPCVQAQTRSLSIRARRRMEQADLADDPRLARRAVRRLPTLFSAHIAAFTLASAEKKSDYPCKFCGECDANLGTGHLA
jgi:hypothetical protein